MQFTSDPVGRAASSPRARRTAASAVLALAVASAVIGPVGTGAVGAASSLSFVYMAPGGTGKSCTATTPCASLTDAINVAPDGAVIVAAAGQYGDQTVRSPSRPQPSKSVTVTSSSAQDANFGTTAVYRSGISFDSVTFVGQLRMAGGSATVRNVHMVGSGILVRSDNITVANSLIEGGFGHDGINIAGSPRTVSNILIRSNTIRDIGAHTKSMPEHPDCIQVFDAKQVTIEQNSIYNCYNSGIIFSAGARNGVSGLLMRANFVQGCLPDRQECSNGGAALDIRLKVTDALITQNTFGRGSVRMPYNPGLTATRNIVGYLSVARPCTTSMTDSLVADYPTWDCKSGAPGKTIGNSSGNTTGSADFVAADQGDLHLRDTSTKARSTAGSNAKTLLVGDDAVDIDSQRFDGTYLGADQPGAGPVVPPHDTQVRTVQNPTISSRVIAVRQGSAGWFRSAVKVAYACEVGSAPLASRCPATEALSGQGTNVVSPRTISAKDGGFAQAAGRTLRIDTVAPGVRAAGVKAGRTYKTVPRVRCAATDRTSGVASCRVVKKISGRTARYTLTATDRAGNTSKKTLQVRLRR